MSHYKPLNETEKKNYTKFIPKIINSSKEAQEIVKKAKLFQKGIETQFEDDLLMNKIKKLFYSMINKIILLFKKCIYS